MTCTRDFSYQALPMRVTFGAGAIANVGEEVTGRAEPRARAVHTRTAPPGADGARTDLGDRGAGIFDQATHARAQSKRADRRPRRAPATRRGQLRGRSAADPPIGLGKAIALEHGLPIIADPHHLRRIGDDPDLGPDPRRAQADRPRPEGAADQRHLRPRR